MWAQLGLTHWKKKAVSTAQSVGQWFTGLVQDPWHHTGRQLGEREEGGRERREGEGGGREREEGGGREKEEGGRGGRREWRENTIIKFYIAFFQSLLILTIFTERILSFMKF